MVCLSGASKCLGVKGSGSNPVAHTKSGAGNGWPGQVLAAVSFTVSFTRVRQRSLRMRQRPELGRRTQVNSAGRRCVDLENRSPSRVRGFKSLRLRPLTSQNAGGCQLRQSQASGKGLIRLSELSLQRPLFGVTGNIRVRRRARRL